MKAVDYGYFPFSMPQGQYRLDVNNVLVVSLVLFAFILMPFTYYIAFKLRKREKIFNIVMISIGIVLIGLEIYKQITYAKIYGYIGKPEYYWKVFPFQLCSVFMYLCPIIPLLKGKLKQAVMIFVGVYAFIGGVCVLGFDAGLNSVLWGFEMQDGTWFGDWGMVVHTLLWHAILINLGSFVFGYFRLGDIPYRGVIKLVISSWVICLCLGVVAEILNTAVPLIYGLDNPQVVGMNMRNVSLFYPVAMPILNVIFELGPSVGGYHILGGLLGFSCFMVVLFLGNLLVQTCLYFGIKLARRYRNVVLYTRDVDI